MPALKGLQSKYGAQGLEVVGIAYEMAGSPQEQAYKVTEVTQKLLINYRQLLGSGPNCVVKTQLGVRAFPTLVLIDEQGTILWRHEGRPSSADLEELERLIQSKTRGAGRI
ncbi:MAG: TlpA disulfide reductase family protein, partial [Planctomycetota bacterium]